MCFMLIDYFRDISLFVLIALVPPATLGGCTLLHFEVRNVQHFYKCLRIGKPLKNLCLELENIYSED
jgi:hypothetical protein